MNNVTLGDMLRILTRLGRQADVGIVYCVRMQDTLVKKRPVVSEFMAGYTLLSAANKEGMVAELPEDLELQCAHPDVICSNGRSRVDTVDNVFCNHCEANVGHLLNGDCAESCCCHDEVCRCCSQCLHKVCTCAMSSSSSAASAPESPSPIMDRTRAAEEARLGASSDQGEAELTEGAETWGSAAAMNQVNSIVSKLVSSANVKIALTADFQAQQSPFQPEDYHPAVSHTKSLMLDWSISGVAFADSMDMRVAGQLDILGNVYSALG